MAEFSVTTLTTAPSQLVEEHVVFTFTALCRASGADDTQVQALVAEGLLQPIGNGPEDWQFSGSSLLRARRTLRLARELELSLHGAAIVMDLLAEIDVLKARR
jgi:chaperone modulatory protein CbpM